MEDYKIKLGKNISKFRKERGITQQELADKTGYKSKAGISDIERGKNTVPIDKLEVIAKVLKVKVSQLINETTEKSKQKEQSITKESRDIEPTIEEIRAKLNESELIELDTLITLNTTMFQKRGDLKDYTKEQIIKALTIAFYDTRLNNDNK